MRAAGISGPLPSPGQWWVCCYHLDVYHFGGDPAFVPLAERFVAFCDRHPGGGITWVRAGYGDADVLDRETVYIAQVDLR